LSFALLNKRALRPSKSRKFTSLPKVAPKILPWLLATNTTSGSEKALQLKEYLIEQKMWSQYLEVGIGTDAEIFTKAPVLAAV
ncbi:hypothetical protein NQ676_19000, partial [Acinetobacter baumannii]|nr:hypothetical protein [Acinetobacter baumannii]